MGGHSLAMRRLFLASTLILASCAPRPQQASSVGSGQPPQQPQAIGRGLLTGLTPNELVARLGSPSLQIREGASVKLQFRNPGCVLDAYLYPSASGQLRVTYVDTRLPSGSPTNQAACMLAFENMPS
jgi:hypothetical protein